METTSTKNIFLKFIIQLVLPIAILFVIIIYFVGCSNSITSSTGTTKTYQARTEAEFINSSVKADPGSVVVINLEDLHSPLDPLLFDTDITGVDIIPFNYSETAEHKISIGDSSYFTVTLINEASKVVIYELSPQNNHTTVTIPAGDYLMVITSLNDYKSGDSLKSQIVFIQPDMEEAFNRGGGEGQVDFDPNQLNQLIRTNSCPRCDLRNVDLHSKDLRRANLSNADLRNADLRSVNLRYSDLRNADLTNAYLTDGYFDVAFMAGVTLRRASLDQTNFEGADLRNANFEGANLRNANFNGTYLVNAKLTAADLMSAKFNYSNLSNANLTLVVAYLADFRNANLNNAILNNGNFRQSNFDYANLKNASLDNAQMILVTFRNAKLTWANLTWTRFDSANLSSADLSFSNFNHTTLSHANLCNTIKIGITVNDVRTNYRTQCWP